MLQLFQLAAQAVGQQFFFVFVGRERITLSAERLIRLILCLIARDVLLQPAEPVQIAQVFPLVEQVLPVVLAMDIQQQRAQAA